jgi:osmotically inducible lipoprotein OsmB
MTRIILVSSLLVLLCITIGCSGMSPQQQRALSGGAIGAAGGAGVAAITGGSPVLGAAIGGGAGALLGAIIPDDDGHGRSHKRHRHHRR